MFEAVIRQKNPDKSTSCSPTRTEDVFLNWKLKKIALHWKIRLEEGKQMCVTVLFLFFARSSFFQPH